MVSVCNGCKRMVPSPTSPITILMRVPFRSPSFRLTGEGKTTCPRELTVVVYTSDLLAVFLLIVSSYSYVRRFSPSFFTALSHQHANVPRLVPSSLLPLLPCARIPPLKISAQTLLLRSSGTVAVTFLGPR